MNLKPSHQWIWQRWLLLAAALTLALIASGPTNVTQGASSSQQGLNATAVPCGILTTDTTWTLAGSPYVLQPITGYNSLTVAANVTLTIEPGVIVQAGSVSTGLIIEGHLEAVGTETQPIVFTSQADSGPGQWRGLTFDGGTGNLRHTIVRHAGRRIYTCPGGANSAAISVVNVQTGTVTLADSQILSTSYYDNSDHGLCVKDSRVMVSNTLFSGIGDNASQAEYPIYIGGPTSDVQLSGLRLENNIYNRVMLLEGALTGHDFTLTAQPVMDGYEFYTGADGGQFVVPAGITMTVEPGVKLMNNWSNGLTLVVRGHLEAVGTAAQPIIFTSHADSGPGQWMGLAFDGGTGNLRHTIVRYAGRGCYGCSIYDGAGILARGVLTGAVRIEASQVMSITGSTSMTNQGLRVENSRVVVSDTTFSGIGDAPAQLDYPVYISGAASDISLSGLRLARNQYNRVLLDLGALTGHDFTLTAQPAMDGYEFYRGAAGSHFIVPAGITMTVEPGVTVLNNFGINLALVVQGRLEALGTEEEPVIFTSHADSGPYQWAGLTFEGGTGLLRHTIVRYAGRGSYGGPGGGAGITVANVQTGTVIIENSQVRDISGGGSTPNYGLTVLNSRVVVSDTRFTAISDAVGASPAVIWVKDSSTLTLSGSVLDGNHRNGLLVEGAARVQVERTAISNNGGHGVLLSGNTAVLTLTNSAVLANTQDGVRNSGNAQVTLGGAPGSGNTIMGNGGFGANQVGTGVQMLATHNWWGDVSGPYHATLNPSGLGENVSNRVLFDPWAVDWEGQAPEGVYVSLVAPRQVVAGEDAAYVAMYVNGGTETVEDAVLLMVLPGAGFFLEATHGGRYLAQQHAVVWQLGDLAPGASGRAAARVQYAWGLPLDSEYAAQARLGGANLPLSLPNPEWYQAFRPLELLGSTPLSAAELAAERAAYPALELLYTQAEAQGFVSGGAVRLELDGVAPITQVVMLQRTAREVLYLRRQGAQVLASTFGTASYAVRDANGGLQHDLQSGRNTFWGTWGSGATPAAPGLAYSNCRYTGLPALMLNNKLTRLSQALSSATCYPCLAGGACTGCFAALQATTPLPEAAEALACAEADPAGDVRPASFWFHPPAPFCDDDEWYVDCTQPWWAFNSKYHWYETTYYCLRGAVIWGTYGVFPLGPTACGKYQTCIEGVWKHNQPKTVGCQCVPVYTPPTPLDAGSGRPLGWSPFTSNAVVSAPATPPPPAAAPPADSRLSGCNSSEPGVSKCPLTRIRRPRDPNAKYGLEGDLIPGQLVTYTVTYENEGDGRAYGVFVVDQLDPALDLTTLTLYGPGELIAENRTILWTVGELGPKGAPDSQGVVSFTIRLRDDLPAGTAVINQATVFFPTAAEETPTNAVVNIVQPLAAVPQRLETAYGQPVAMTLTGRPASVPLTFEVLEGPLNGALSGTAPNLIYTPAENVTGVDTFTFRVRGAGQASRPAQVQLVITPVGDVTAPTVRGSYPLPGATGIGISASPLFTDDVGPVYGPLPWIQFSEAISATTLPDQAVQLVNAQGQVLLTSVVYDSAAHRALLYPRAPLQPALWYTATLAAGVQDLAGNPLAANYVWRFQTADVAIAGLSAVNSGPTTLGQATTLTATVAAGTNVSYAWAFGDGGTAQGATVAHTYQEVGVYTATVTAANSSGPVSTTTVVTIRSAYHYVYLPLVLRNP